MDLEAYTDMEWLKLKLLTLGSDMILNIQYTNHIRGL